MPEQEAHERQPVAGPIELEAFVLHELGPGDCRSPAVIVEEIIDALNWPGRILAADKDVQVVAVILLLAGHGTKTGHLVAAIVKD